LNRGFDHRESDVRIAHCLIAVGALGLLATDVAAAKPRHAVVTPDSSHESHGVQKTGGEQNGFSKNSTGAATNSGDKGGQSPGGTAENGSLKKGGNPPGKGGLQDAGKGAIGGAGKTQIGEGADGNHSGVTQSGPKPGAVSAEPIRTDNVIVDRPRRNAKKSVVGTPKKIITTSRPPVTNQRPTGLTAIGGAERNAVGVALSNDKEPKLNSDSKVDGKGTETGLPGVAGTKSGPVVPAPNIDHPVNNGSDGPPKITAGLNGSLISRPGVAPGTIGGPAKNIASINGTTFRPKRGR
jgi:hypothetical protein